MPPWHLSYGAERSNDTMPMEKIWTLDARDTVLFDVVMKDSGLSPVHLGADIRLLHAETVRLLATKGVAYRDLRAALVPHTTTTDIALLFDSELVGSRFYGWEVATEILPLVDRRWRGSILEGDLIHHDQDRAFDLINAYVELAREAEIRDTSQIFAVYLSNLSDARVQRLLAGLREYPPSLGTCARATTLLPQRTQ